MLETANNPAEKVRQLQRRLRECAKVFSETRLSTKVLSTTSVSLDHKPSFAQ